MMDTYEVPHLDIYLSSNRTLQREKAEPTSLCLSQSFETPLSELIGPVTSAMFVRTYIRRSTVHAANAIDRRGSETAM